jgi:CRP-like cAMP-binding protein
LNDSDTGTVLLEPAELLRRLRGFPILQNLQDFHLQNVAKNIRVLRYSPGDLVAAKGDVGNEFFLLDRGRIGILQDEHVCPTADADSIKLDEIGSDESQQGDGSSSSVLLRAFKGRFTSSPSKLRSTGVASAILSYASGAYRVRTASATKEAEGEGEGESSAPPAAPSLAQKVKATLSAGMFFGEGALLGDGKRGASVCALTHCTLFSLNHEAFVRLMKLLENPPSPEKEKHL